jgi:hypothetical protein
MKFEQLRRPFWPATLAIILSVLGWLIIPRRPVIYADAIPGVEIVEAFCALPGGFLAAMMAMFFSPQGVHGIEQFAWIILPANLVIYFALFTALFSNLREWRKNRKREQL